MTTNPVLRYHVFMSNIPHRVKGNCDAYKLRQLVQSDAASVYTSTCKLWYTMLLLMRSDYTACLRTVNDLLSRIPPYALYMSYRLLRSSMESKSIYEHVYLQSDADKVGRIINLELPGFSFQRNSKSFVQHFYMACEQQNLKSLAQHFCIAAFLCTMNLSISMRQQKKIETLEFKMAEMERQWFLSGTEWHVGNRIWNHVYSTSFKISYNNLKYNDNEYPTASIHSWLLFVSYHSIFYYIIFFYY